MSLDEVLHMSANKIRSQLANKGIDIPPLETQSKAMLISRFAVWIFSVNKVSLATD